MKHRLYVDEVGNSDMGASEDPNHRYLSLTGVIISLKHVQDCVVPEMEALKAKNFTRHHPDEPLILHRKELMNKKHPFVDLRDPLIEHQFNESLLGCINGWEYTVITVTIDKLQHQQRYMVWRYDPYHYCLQVLVEKYVLWLKSQGAHGDVMAEGRQGKPDKRLKESFQRVYEHGTDFVEQAVFTERLTSKELKIKQKTHNIAGLQLADLLAHPSFKLCLAKRNRQAPPTGFGGRISTILEASKYNRSPSGKIDGWGSKWLP